MPSAYGTDRVKQIGAAFLLTSQREKGWRARRRATHTRKDFPGTAVDWDGVMYEVVAVDETPGRVSYRLEPWRNEQTVRQLDHYDEASEAARLARWREHARRMQIGQRIQAAGVLTGMLPAEAQRRLANRFGVSIRRIMLMSTVLPMLFGIWCAKFLKIHPNLPSPDPPFPEWLVPFGIYLFLESLVRVRSYLSSLPMGSVLGWIVYLPWLLFGGRRVLDTLDEEELKGASSHGVAYELSKRRHAKVEEKAWGELPDHDADAERRLHDAFIMREPLVALLPRGDQLAMARRFGFDPLVQGRWSVAVLAIASTVGLVFGIHRMSSDGPTFSRLLSTAVAILLLIDQFQRARDLAKRQPAPSILGAIARPFVRNVLASPGVQPVFEGEGRNVVMPDVWEDGDEEPSEDAPPPS